ncbi:hypothetical protein P6X57_000745 [Campylobacter coli]|nr:hypothetical protein [Campylobacter coli]
MQNDFMNQETPNLEIDPARESVYDMSDEDFEKWRSEAISSVPNTVPQQEVTEESDDNSDTNIEETQEPSREVDTEPLNDSNDDNIESNENTEENQISEPSRYKIRADGQDLEFTLDELIKLAPKAMNYTKKMQQIAPFRRTISALEENQVSEDEINQFIEMRNGNAVAISNFLRSKNMNINDIDNISDDEVSGYKANKYGREHTRLDDIVEDIKSSEHYNKLVDYVSQLDPRSKEIIQRQPETLNILINEMASGHFDRIKAEASKKALLYGSKKADLEYYIDSANALYDSQRKEYEATVKNKQTEQKINNRAKAGLSGNAVYNNKGVKKVVEQIEEISDDDFNEFYRKLNFNR